MKESLTSLNETLTSDTNLSEANSGKADFSNLISELTNFKNEGNSLYKSKKKNRRSEE